MPVESRNRPGRFGILSGAAGPLRIAAASLGLLAGVAAGAEEKDRPLKILMAVVRDNGQRIFYTRYDPDDVMKDEGARALVVRAIGWAAQRDLEALRLNPAPK